MRAPSAIVVGGVEDSRFPRRDCETCPHSTQTECEGEGRGKQDNSAIISDRFESNYRISRIAASSNGREIKTALRALNTARKGCRSLDAALANNLTSRAVKSRINRNHSTLSTIEKPRVSLTRLRSVHGDSPKAPNSRVRGFHRNILLAFGPTLPENRILP